MTMLILGLAMAVLSGDPDGIVTAGRTPALTAPVAAAAPDAPAIESEGVQAAAHGLNTAEQIDRWIADRDPAAQPFSDDGLGREERKVHGYVEAGIGTGGYRSVGGGVSLPIGEEGRLDLHFRKTEGERFYGYPGYGSPGYGYGYRGSPFEPYGAFGPRGSSRSFGAEARWERQDKDEAD